MRILYKTTKFTRILASCIISAGIQLIQIQSWVFSTNSEVGTDKKFHDTYFCMKFHSQYCTCPFTYMKDKRNEQADKQLLEQML